MTGNRTPIMFNHLIWSNCVQVVFLSCLGLEIQVTRYFSDILLLRDVLHKDYKESPTFDIPLCFLSLWFFIFFTGFIIFLVFSTVFVQPGHWRKWGTNSCADSSDRAAWTMIGRVNCTVRPTSKVPSEGDTTRQGVMQSSVKAFNLLRIGVLIVLSRTTGDNLMRYKHGAWSRSWEKMVLKHFDLG